MPYSMDTVRTGWDLLRRFRVVPESSIACHCSWFRLLSFVLQAVQQLVSEERELDENTDSFCRLARPKAD
jgi:hypothetical protein